MHGLFEKFTWTDERVEKLKALHAQGLTGTEIATALDPSRYLTRNAVRGKLNRLGLCEPHIPAAFKVARKPVATNNFNGVNAQRRAKRDAEVIPQLEASEPVDIAPETSVHAVSLFNVAENQCRWPLNDAGPGFRFCGAKRDGEGSYCERHHSIAKGGGTRSERNAVKEMNRCD